MIVFNSAIGKTTLDDSVKSLSFEQLKEKFEGTLDYVSLAAQLGIKPTKGNSKPKVESEKDSIGADKK